MPPLTTLLAALLAAGATIGLVVARRRMATIRTLTPGPTPGPAPVPVVGATSESSPPAERDQGRRPSVAVVVAARDEAPTIEPALASLLAQAGDDVRIVVVDDRSSDGTTEILRSLGAKHPELVVVRVDELPAGWLGKNHALQRGAEAAGEVDFLLFTDADVVFAPGGVRAAAEDAAKHRLDHLTGAPRVHASSFSLAGMVASFGVLFGLFTRPWRVSDPMSSAAVGIGALNLVRRSAYESAGGHAPIRMRIDDDLRLGMLIKDGGGRSEFVFAEDVASVEWYPTLGAMVRGLHKNAFAGIDFRVTVALAATAFIVLVFLVPYTLPFVPGVDPAARALAAVAATAHLLGAADGAARTGLRPSAALFFPLGLVIFLFILWRSTLGALVTRRVVWRGTAYPLAELLKARDLSRRAPRA